MCASTCDLNNGKLSLSLLAALSILVLATCNEYMTYILSLLVSFLFTWPLWMSRETNSWVLKPRWTLELFGWRRFAIQRQPSNSTGWLFYCYQTCNKKQSEKGLHCRVRINLRSAGLSSMPSVGSCIVIAKQTYQFWHRSPNDFSFNRPVQSRL